MPHHAGAVIFVTNTPDGRIYKVGVSARTEAGKVVADGTVQVTVPADAGDDEPSWENAVRGLALTMVDQNPNLLTAVSLASQGHQPSHGTVTIAGDGKNPGSTSKHNTEKGADRPSHILSPDSSGVDL